MNRKGIIIAVPALLVVALVAFLLLRRGSGSASAEEKEPAAEVTVKFGKIQRTTLRAYVSGFGNITPEPATSGNPPASAKIGSPVAGLLAESRAVEGQTVAKGATLFQLDSRVANVQVEKARQAMEFAQIAFDRQQRLLSVDGTSKRLYQEAEQNLQAAKYELANATAQRALLTITAPIAGTVVHVMAKPGDAIDLSNALAEIVDLDRLVVSAKVRTSDASALHMGQRVEISPGRPEASDQVGRLPAAAAATLSYIGADVDQANDSVTVRALLPPHSGLRPNEFVTLRVLAGEHKDVLAVPLEAVVSDVGSSEASIAIIENNVGKRHPVTLGIKDNGLVEISGEGLKEGTVIATTGAYGLPDNTKVREAGKE